jgi:hypothetical protein
MCMLLLDCFTAGIVIGRVVKCYCLKLLIVISNLISVTILVSYLRLIFIQDANTFTQPHKVLTQVLPTMFPCNWPEPLLITSTFRS